MKKIISNTSYPHTSYFFFLLPVKKTFNINAEWQDITVVYGLLDQSRFHHYIRVNKAFLGNGNALTMAKNFDSTNYPQGCFESAACWNL